jgi:macrolide transport system ATP-binding/permease protein
MTEPLLRLRGVSRTYGAGRPNAVDALKSINLDIYAGEFVAIVGPSGGGKTTLMSVLGLLDVPTDGSYQLDGVETTTLPERQRTRLRARDLGFVFQAFHLLDRRPVTDSVEMGLLYRGVSTGQRRQRADAALERLGMTERAGVLAKDLSGGERQRVAISRALASSTRIVLADEPTGNLDSRNGEAVLNELREFHAAGATVIVVTHSEEVAAAAHRTIRISDGMIVDDTGPSPAAEQTEWAADGGDGREAIRWVDLWRDAITSVLSRGAQTAALALAVALAVGLIVVSLGLGETAGAQVSGTFDAHANREVSGQAPLTSGQAPLTSGNPLNASDIVTRTRTIAGVDAVATLVTHGPVHVTALGSTASVSARLFTGDFAVATDSHITWAADAHGHQLDQRSVLIGRTLAGQLELGPLNAGPTVDIDGVRFAVVGTIDSSSRYPELAGQIVAGMDAPLTGGAQTVTIAIRTATGAAQQVGRQLPAAADPFAPGQVTVNVPVDASTLRQSIESGVQIALTAFTALAVLIAIATLANAIGMSVIARRGEFGLRRAVGAQAPQLAALVASESAVIGFVGGIIGLVLGAAAILVFTIVQRWMPVFDLRLAPLAVALGVVLAVVSSIIGAVRAARIRPAIALRE